MLVIGLTGPSGAGKGETGRVFATLGAVVIDCDAVYHEMLRSHEGLKAALAEAFPGSVRTGTVDRRELARQAFADPEALRRLNTITHGIITIEINEMLSCTAADGAQTVVLDAPTLFESGADRLCHVTVGVLAPAALRNARVAARDALPQAALAARMAAQKPDEFYRSRCTHILENDGDLSALRQKAEALYANLTEGKEAP